MDYKSPREAKSLRRDFFLFRKFWRTTIFWEKVTFESATLPTKQNLLFKYTPITTITLLKYFTSKIYVMRGENVCWDITVKIYDAIYIHFFLSFGQKKQSPLWHSGTLHVSLKPRISTFISLFIEKYDPLQDSWGKVLALKIYDLGFQLTCIPDESW